MLIVDSKIDKDPVPGIVSNRESLSVGITETNDQIKIFSIPEILIVEYFRHVALTIDIEMCIVTDPKIGVKEIGAARSSES